MSEKDETEIDEKIKKYIEKKINELEIRLRDEGKGICGSYVDVF